MTSYNNAQVFEDEVTSYNNAQVFEDESSMNLFDEVEEAKDKVEEAMDKNEEALDTETVKNLRQRIVHYNMGVFEYDAEEIKKGILDLMKIYLGSLY